jgi:hypothetical protein
MSLSPQGNSSNYIGQNIKCQYYIFTVMLLILNCF